MNFHDDLRRFGPDASYTISRDEARAYCARLTATHYENFHVVTWLTPRAVRPAFQAVYSFCRWSDDLGDEVGDRDRATRLLAWWKSELRMMYEGQARHPVFLALAEVVEEYAIPIEPFEALISAFEQDQRVLEYETYPQVLDYCTRSADPVGHLVLYLARAFNPENARLSDATCTALQLANHWQDVARDLAIGRIYLPREDRMRFGVADADLRSRRFTPAFGRLMAFEVDRVRAMFERGWPLVERLPRAFAIDVDLFTRGGLAILKKIEAGGYDVLTERPSLRKSEKLGLLGRAVLGRFRLRRPRATRIVAGEGGDAASRGPVPVRPSEGATP